MVAADLTSITVLFSINEPLLVILIPIRGGDMIIIEQAWLVKKGKSK
jgi:hypothetical protein